MDPLCDAVMHIMTLKDRVLSNLILGLRQAYAASYRIWPTQMYTDVAQLSYRPDRAITASVVIMINPKITQNLAMAYVGPTSQLPYNVGLTCVPTCSHCVGAYYLEFDWSTLDCWT